MKVPFLCCGSFGDTKPQNSPQKKAFRALPGTSIRASLIRTYDTDIEEFYYLDRDHELGKGGCGVVVIGEHKETHVQYAIKIVNKASAERGRLDRELKLLKDVDHANIVRLFSVYESSAFMYFVMELCLGGHLGNLIARQPNKYLDEEWAKRLCRQILSAVSHIHSRGIAHRDIKLQNILIDCNNDRIAQIKLIDFGYGSRFLGNLPMKTKCGTPYTTAPEVIRENYDERCDIWSVGVVLYIMLCGRRPFETLDIGGPLTDAGKAAMITNILAGRYHFNHRPWQTVSRTGIQFVKSLLHPDYRSRIRAHEALESTWLLESAAASPSKQSKHNSQSSLLSAKSFRAVSKIRQSIDYTHMQKTGMVALVFGLQSRVSTDLRTVFQSFDTDMSGSISRKEFHSAMAKLAPELALPDIDILFDTIDIDKNQQLSFTEFLIATLDPREVDIEELNNAFRVLDEDGNGFITKDELRKVIRTQLIQALENEHRNEQGELVKQIQPTDAIIGSLYQEVEARVEEIFSQVDVNGDGKISRTEFLCAMTGSVEFLPLNQRMASSKSKSNLLLKREDSNTRTGSTNQMQDSPVNRRAASTSDLANAVGPRRSPNRRMSEQTGTLGGSATIITPSIIGNRTDSPSTPAPPNFRGIIARNQIQQFTGETNVEAKPELSPKIEVKNGTIAHYTMPEEISNGQLATEELDNVEQPEDNRSTGSSYDTDKVGRLFGPSSSKHNSRKGTPQLLLNNNQEEGHDSGKYLLKPSTGTALSPINDRDTIYRMSEVEEEKSEFISVTPKPIPAERAFRSTIISESPDIDNNTTNDNVIGISRGPGIGRTRLPVSRGTSFKRDISAKFADIATMSDHNEDAVESIPPMLGSKIGSRNFSVSSLKISSQNN